MRCVNTKGAYGDPNEEGYYKKLADAFKVLMRGKTQSGVVTIDCANGVGAPKMRALVEAIGKDYFDAKFTNEDVDHPKKLNYQVSFPMPGSQK